jgi:hypothetical protein
MKYLNSIATDVSIRIIETKKLFKHIENLDISEPIDIKNTLMGLIFISLYSVYEYAIASTIRITLTTINAKGHRPQDINPMFYSIAYHPQFECLIESGKDRKWKSRVQLLEKIENNEVFEINEAISPNGGKNYRYEQLEYLWKCFCIKDPIFPNNDLKYRGRVEELVRRRNEIAHGDHSSATVGKQYTMSELVERIEDINLYIYYMLNVFDSHIDEEKYRKITA